MNEIKGLLWYILSTTTIITGLLFLKYNVMFSLLMLFFAGADAVIGFLYYFGVIDKSNNRRRR